MEEGIAQSVRPRQPRGCRRQRQVLAIDRLVVSKRPRPRGKLSCSTTTDSLKVPATMATKQDAAEQAKEFLRQVIKYRFWISISVAALFAVIAYLVGSGPVRDNADKERKSIIAAEKDVQQYNVPTIPTSDYMPVVEKKTQVLDKDVTVAWKTLFDRQAPLLTWPATVAKRFPAWGRKWPEKVEPTKVELAIADYIDAYPAFVSMVYKTCNPFDYETGAGIVSTPGQDDLLRPTKFDPEKLPDLGKVWAAQERLWIQRTLLEVVAEVNKNAKTWDEAPIRQIVELEVGNSISQDQRSIAKNDTLLEAEAIPAPGDPPPDTGTGATPSAGGLPGGKGGGMGNFSMGGMGGAGAAAATENVFYVKSDSDKFKIMPILMSVLIDQDRVQDFLIELENSPMWIQVKDFELLHPTSRVTKPEKGEEAGGAMGMMGGMGVRQMSGMSGMMGMSGMGGMMQQQQNMMQQQSRMQQQMVGGMTGMGGGRGGMGGFGGGTAVKKGTSTKGKDPAKKREDEAKAAAEAKGPSFLDPYFNIVQVRIYGQARFFKPPPDVPAAEPSPGDVAGATAAPASNEAAKGGSTDAPAAKDAAKAEPAEESPSATTGAVEKPAPAPDSIPKNEGAAKTDSAPAGKQAASPTEETDEPDAKTSKTEPAPKTQPEKAKPKS